MIRNRLSCVGEYCSHSYLFIQKNKNNSQGFPSQTHKVPLKSIWTLHVWISLQKYKSKRHLCFSEPLCATGVLLVYIKVFLHIKNEHVPLTLDNRAAKNALIWSVYQLFIMFMFINTHLLSLHTRTYPSPFSLFLFTSVSLPLSRLGVWIRPCLILSFRLFLNFLTTKACLTFLSQSQQGSGDISSQLHRENRGPCYSPGQVSLSIPNTDSWRLPWVVWLLNAPWKRI